MRLRRIGFVLLLSMPLFGIPLASSQAQVICTGNASPPPELPVYDQPPMPEPGYIWTPGYWGGGPLGYFWVPGTWVEPPAVGLLWTPGYWGFRDGIYVWNAGYWGPHVGFYGGVDYGFGYDGAGYLGGRWANGVFAYNRSVNNFGTVRVTNVYEEKITTNNVTRVSFNGGPGGIALRATPEEEAVAREQHVAAIPLQIQHERTAGANKELLSSENHGRPPIAATVKPGEFVGKGVIAAREARPNEREGRPGERVVRPGEEGLQKPNNAMRPADIGDKPKERDDTPKARETVKREAEPNPPANNAASPNIKPHRDEAKLPADKADTPKLREKPSQGATANPPPPKVATNPHPKQKPGPEEKKPQQ
jgi:WXXGXW repeat (2 copies)